MRMNVGHVLMSDEHEDVESYYREYIEGANGRPALKDLEEQGKKWRAYRGGRQKWYKRLVIIKEIERTSVEAVQRLLDDVQKTSKKSKKPNWYGLWKKLHDEEKQRKIDAEAAGAAAAIAATGATVMAPAVGAHRRASDDGRMDGCETPLRRRGHTARSRSRDDSSDASPSPAPRSSRRRTTPARFIGGV